MEVLKSNEQACEIVLTPQDVESAIMQFICTCKPEFAKDWLLSAKYNLGTVVMAATKQ